MVKPPRTAATARAALRFNSRVRIPAQHSGFAAPAHHVPERYAFFGLGRMGYPMLKNLRARLANNDVINVFDVDRTIASKLVSELKAGPNPGSGARINVVESVEEAAEGVRNVITVLPAPSHVSGVVNAILQSSRTANPQRLFIDCSTIDPTTSRELASAVSTAKQGTFIDAPMSGGVPKAISCNLTFMLGCSLETLPIAKAVLLNMGDRILHCGETNGAGLAAKLANNYILAASNLAVAEAMNFGIRCGVDAEILANVISNSTGRCWPVRVNNPVPGVIKKSPSCNEYEGGFSTSLMIKDLGLVEDSAREVGARMLLMDRMKDVYETVDGSAELKGKDFSVVYKYLGGVTAVPKASKNE